MYHQYVTFSATHHLAQKRMAVGHRGPEGGNNGLYCPSNKSMMEQEGGATCRRINPWLTRPRVDFRSCANVSWKLTPIGVLQNEIQE